MRPPSPDAESHGQIIPPVRPRAAACSTLAASTHRLPESWGERTRKRRTIIPTPTGAAPTGQTKPSPKSAATLNTKLSQASFSFLGRLVGVKMGSGRPPTPIRLWAGEPVAKLDAGARPGRVTYCCFEH